MQPFQIVEMWRHIFTSGIIIHAAHIHPRFLYRVLQHSVMCSLSGMSRWRCDIQRHRLNNRQALYITVDSDMYLSIFIAATNRFARTLSIAIAVINRLGHGLSIATADTNTLGRYRPIHLVGLNIFRCRATTTTVHTIVWGTGPSIDTADDNGKRNLSIDGHYGR